MHFLDGRRLPFLSIVFVRKGHGGEFRGGGGWWTCRGGEV